MRKSNSQAELFADLRDCGLWDATDAPPAEPGDERQCLRARLRRAANRAIRDFLKSAPRPGR